MSAPATRAASRPRETPERAAFHVTAKPRGAVCNLACRYCFYLPKLALHPGGDPRMSDGMLRRYVRQHIEAHDGPEVTFTWQGGEPTLMGLEFFRRAVELQRRYRRPGTRVHNHVQTNATTLDDDWCAFFAAHAFLVGVSLDGPRHLHDAYRVDRGGLPSFDRVMAGLARLHSHSVEVNVLTAVHAANAGHGLEVYRFLRDEAHAHVIQLIPIVERGGLGETGAGASLTAWSVTGPQYGELLVEIFDEWVRRDVGRVFVQLFDAALGVWLGHPASLCTLAETCGQAVALEHNGDLYSCDHFVDPGHRLGNLAETPLATLLASPRQRAFGLAKRDTLPRCCRECEVRFACHGGCPKDRVLASPDGEPGLNALCAGWKAFFTHVDRPMRVMADLVRRQCSPALVMSLAAGPRPQGSAGG